jgi:hypothetical protein
LIDPLSPFVPIHSVRSLFSNGEAGMLDDYQDLGGLRFMVDGSGVGLADVVLLELPETDRKTSWVAVIQGNFAMIQVPGLANPSRPEKWRRYCLPEPESWCAQPTFFNSPILPNRE